MQHLAGMKRISRWNSNRVDRRLAVLGICGGMVGLVVKGAALGVGVTFDGVYTGKRVLTKGSSGSRCPAEDDVSVTIQGETLTFTNSALRNFPIGFDPDKDGSFSQTYVDEGGGAVEIRGRVIGDVLEADVTNMSTSCEHHWRLKKG